MDLKIIRVNNKSNPEDESISIEVLEKTNLSKYMVCDQTFGEYDQPSGLHRHFYRFPNKTVEEGDLVILYTKLKYSRESPRESGGKIHRFGWGLNKCIWNDKGDTAHLVKIENSQSFKVKAAE